MTRVLSVIASLALVKSSQATALDPCTALCNRGGPSICTEGSWSKGNGICHAYLFRGDPSRGEYCYHTTTTAATCPSGGAPVRASDVARLLGGNVGVTRTVSVDATSTTRTTTITEQPLPANNFELTRAVFQAFIAGQVPTQADIRTVYNQFRTEGYSGTEAEIEQLFNMELEFRRQDDWRGRDAYIGKYISDSAAAVTTTAAPATTMPLRTYPREVEAQLLRMRARARCYNCKTSRCD